MRFASTRERRLWTLLAVYALLLYGSAYFLQFALDFLRQRDLLAAALGTAFGGAAVTVALPLFWRRPGWRELLVLLVAALVYVLLLRRMHVLQERLHLIEYGLVGLLALEGFRERWDAARRGSAVTARAAAAAIALALVLGWIDELIQGILPNRYYDLRDVGFNLLAAALAIGVTLLRERARRRDRARRGASDSPPGVRSVQ